MDYQVIWAPAAIEDLEAAVARVARDNPPEALALGEEILRHVDILQTFPRIGPVYDRAADPRIRHVLCRSHWILYRVRDKTHVVDILHLWHSTRRDPIL